VPCADGSLQAIDLLHEQGGTFLAIPLTPAGAPQPRTSWRRALSRQVALQGA
jgi:hypothetical protein